MQSHFNWAFILGIYTALPRASVFCPNPPPRPRSTQSTWLCQCSVTLLTIYRCSAAAAAADAIRHFMPYFILTNNDAENENNRYTLMKFNTLRKAQFVHSHCLPCPSPLHTPPPSCTRSYYNTPAAWSEWANREEGNENEKQQQKSENIFVVSHQISN